VNAGKVDNCNTVIRHELEKQQPPSKHNALLPVQTRRPSLFPRNQPGNRTCNSQSWKLRYPFQQLRKTTSNCRNNQKLTDFCHFPSIYWRISTQTSTNPFNQFSQAFGQTLTPKTPSTDTKEQNQSPTARNDPQTCQTSSKTPIQDQKLAKKCTQQSIIRQEFSMKHFSMTKIQTMNKTKTDCLKFP
jgi:hypothetical protein